MDELKLRTKLKRKKPDFLRQSVKNVKRVGHKWRKPKGIQSKLRMHKISRGFIPNIGYGSPKAVRNLHPSGLEDVLVYNVNDLQTLDAKKQACRIASNVGRKKRLEIIKKASEMKIKILNPQKVEKKKQEDTKKKADKK